MLPYDVVMNLGRAVALPYDVVMNLGRAVALPYVVMILGCAVALPYGVVMNLGRAVALPYDVVMNLGRAVALPYDVVIILIYWEMIVIEILLKMEGAEAIYVSIKELPSQSDTLLIGHYPRLQGDKPVPFLWHDPDRVVIPIHRIQYIEILEEVSIDHIPTPWRPD